MYFNIRADVAEREMEEYPPLLLMLLSTCVLNIPIALFPLTSDFCFGLILFLLQSCYIRNYRFLPLI